MTPNKGETSGRHRIWTISLVLGLTFASEGELRCFGKSTSSKADSDGYSIAVIERTQRARPDPNARAFINRAAYIDLGNYGDAVADLALAIANPKNARAFINRCAAYIKLASYDDAVADCTQAIALNPTDPLAYTNRCGAYISWGNYSEAIADCTRRSRVDPKERARLHQSLVLPISNWETTTTPSSSARSRSRSIQGTCAPSIIAATAYSKRQTTAPRLSTARRPSRLIQRTSRLI